MGPNRAEFREKTCFFHVFSCFFVIFRDFWVPLRNRKKHVFFMIFSKFCKIFQKSDFRSYTPGIGSEAWPQEKSYSGQKSSTRFGSRWPNLGLTPKMGVTPHLWVWTQIWSQIQIRTDPPDPNQDLDPDMGWPTRSPRSPRSGNLKKSEKSEISDFRIFRFFRNFSKFFEIFRNFLIFSKFREISQKSKKWRFFRFFWKNGRKRAVFRRFLRNVTSPSLRRFITRHRTAALYTSLWTCTNAQPSSILTAWTHWSVCLQV